MLRKLKGIMPDFNRSSRKQGPLHQLLEGSSAAAAQQQQQQLEEMQEHPEAEAEAQESRSSSGPFRAWSPTNTLFGDRGLGSVPVETPTASLQVRCQHCGGRWQGNLGESWVPALVVPAVWSACCCSDAWAMRCLHALMP
jgi:hypothetical protein